MTTKICFTSDIFVTKFGIASYNIFGDMNYFLPFFVQYRVQTEYRVETESDTYEPSVQLAQLGLKIGLCHETHQSHHRSQSIQSKF